MKTREPDMKTFFQASRSRPVSQEAQNFNQMEEPESRLERRVYLRDPSHGAFAPKSDTDSLGQGLWKTERFPRQSGFRREQQGQETEALDGLYTIS